jgi:hypothetical protein
MSKLSLYLVSGSCIPTNESFLPIYYTLTTYIMLQWTYHGTYFKDRVIRIAGKYEGYILIQSSIRQLILRITSLCLMHVYHCHWIKVITCTRSTVKQCKLICWVLAAHPLRKNILDHLQDFFPFSWKRDFSLLLISSRVWHSKSSRYREKNYCNIRNPFH